MKLSVEVKPTLLIFAFYFLFSATAAIAMTNSPRESLPLANWRFALDDLGDRPAAISFDDSAWENVTLPHTWNAFDGGTGGNRHYFRGTGWYRAHFTLPVATKEKRVLLEVDGASDSADVFVNGKLVGTHTGGFARFRFDVTDAVKFAGSNLVTIRVNNATNDFLPRNGDFTIFGGLYRPARVVLTAPAHIATLDHASPGIFLTAQNVSTNGADVEARIEFANDAVKNFSGTVRATVNSPDGVKISTRTAKIEIAANGAGETNLALHLSRPHLWNGVPDPFVYQVTVELLDDSGRPIDSVGQPLGLRSFAVKPDAGFFLNGNPIQLHGVNRHQDWPDKGWAIDTNNMTEDMRVLQDLGANAVRLCHYQHDQFFYDLCDQAGLAVWAELCFVNEPPLTQLGRDNAKEQMRELIRQNYNHPAIFFWSIGNETSEARGSDAASELLKELAAIVREEDPSRVSTYASHHSLTDRRNFISDIVAFNKYFGWYGGTFPEIGKFLDDFHAANPQRPVGLSEYGAGASIYQHAENPSLQTNQAPSLWHPEELQAKYHEEYWLQLKTRPWVWGAFVWCLFDFASATRTEGDTFGRNDKGLVTADRQIRKDAFYWYQANWTTNLMVHIASKRFYDRTNASIELKVYSNADEVEAKLNGLTLGKKASGDRRFVWSEIRLQPGVNRIEAAAWRAGKMVATDSCGWNLRSGNLPQAAESEAMGGKK